MFYLMAAFCVGPIILYCYGKLLPGFVIILFSICCLSLVKFRCFLPVVCCFLGLLYTNSAIKTHLSATISAQYFQGEQVIEAYLCSVPVVYPHYTKADFCLLDSRTGLGTVPGRKVKLSWSSAIKLDQNAAYYKLKIELKPARGSVNFTGSAYEQYLFYKRVSALGRIIMLPLVQSADETRFTFKDYVRFKANACRLKLDSYIKGLLEGLVHKGLIRALLLGERSGIAVEDARVLQYTGTQHLLAISGLHVGLVMLCLFRLMPSTVWRSTAVSLLGLAYVVLVGGSESAIRAWVMATLALALVSGRWRRSYLYIYALAMFVVLVVDPLSPMNIGFWYSFLCVALLLLLSRFASTSYAGWRSLVLIQLLLIGAMAPVNALAGGAQGLASVFANLFAVPWVSLLVLPLSLVALLASALSVPVSEVLLGCADIALQLLVQYLSSLSGLLHEFSLGTRVGLLIAFIIVFLALVIFIRHLWLRFIFCTVLLLVLLTPSDANEYASEVIVFDAGQGLAVAMAWEGQYWLYDTGLSMGSYSLAESAIFPYFRAKEMLSNLSGLIVSHGDADHAGGAVRVNEYLVPDFLWSGESGRVPGLRNEQACEAGMSWELIGGRIEVIYPFASSDLENISSNNHSCVLRYTYRGFSFLLMGDLEGDAEMRLVEHYRNELKADVLVAGHHGSANASSIALLKSVQPEFLVISAGYRNRFGHPHPDVLERAKLMGINVLSTGSQGALRFLLGGSTLKVDKGRHERAAFWIFGEGDVYKGR